MSFSAKSCKIASALTEMWLERIALKEAVSQLKKRSQTDLEGFVEYAKKTAPNRPSSEPVRSFVQIAA